MLGGKMLVTGSHGFVGSRVMQQDPEAIAVPGTLVRDAGDGLTEFVKKHRPDVILNAAAISDIGTCEKQPDLSYAANVTLPVVLARAAAAVGAKLISFSSDQVYTGCTSEGPYSEAEPLPSPANLYARHKLEAEERVLDIAPDAVLLRATWMYDMPLYGNADWANRGNFLVNTLSAVLHGRAMQYSDREYRGITYVRQVVELLAQAAALPGGVYNYGSENALHMLDTARALLDALGLTAETADSGQVRHNLWMDCGKLRRNGLLFDSTAEGFRRCVQDYGLRW